MRRDARIRVTVWQENFLLVLQLKNFHESDSAEIVRTAEMSGVRAGIERYQNGRFNLTARGC